MYDSGFRVQVLGITVQGLGIEGYGFGAYLLKRGCGLDSLRALRHWDSGAMDSVQPLDSEMYAP